MINNAILRAAAYNIISAAKHADDNNQIAYHLNVVLGWVGAAVVNLNHVVQEFRQRHKQ